MHEIQYEDPNDSPQWERFSACGKRPDLDWFSSDPDEKYKCRAVCQSECPVRKRCIDTALNEPHIHGIWGGVDDYEIRRTLSVDADGEPKVRKRSPRCPYCMSRKLTISGQKTKKGYSTTCDDCGLHWHMAVIPAKLKTRRAV